MRCRNSYAWLLFLALVWLVSEEPVSRVSDCNPLKQNNEIFILYQIIGGIIETRDVDDTPCDQTDSDGITAIVFRGSVSHQSFCRTVMESTEAPKITPRGGGVISFKGLASEPDLSEEILKGSDDVPAAEETISSTAEESFASSISLVSEVASPLAVQKQVPVLPSREIITPKSSSVTDSGRMIQTSPLGIAVCKKVSHY